MLTLFNSLTRKKEQFTPGPRNSVFLYVCGVTPYDDAHIGHGRCYVFFDLVYRVLKLNNYEVNYCRNYTDIDDKLLACAQKELGDMQRYSEIAERNIARYQEDMAALNCMVPTNEPRVTRNIPAIIKFIEGLITKGKAYVADGDVYFSVASFPTYGNLSRQKLDELRVGARVQVNKLKKDPLDFALWKSEAENTFWQSPWSWGRPGWHIECSVLAQEYLGEHIDVHGGGMDLLFPHHENERAQSEALHGAPFTRFWLHNAFVRVNKEKMSKSLGNFFTLRQVFEKVDAMAVRYYLLSVHYRSPLDFSLDDLAGIQKSYQRLCRAFEACSTVASSEQMHASETVQRMLTFLYDDFNTSGMFGVLFDSLSDLKHNEQELCAVKTFLQEVVGLTLAPLPEKEITMTPEIEQLLADREQARRDKDWAKADELRDQLKKLGVDVQDKKL